MFKISSCKNCHFTSQNKNCSKLVHKKMVILSVKIKIVKYILQSQIGSQSWSKFFYSCLLNIHGRISNQMQRALENPSGFTMPWLQRCSRTKWCKEKTLFLCGWNSCFVWKSQGWDIRITRFSLISGAVGALIALSQKRSTEPVEVL